MKNHVKKRAGLFAAALLTIGGAAVIVSTPVNAAPGDNLIVNGDFSNYDPATGANLDGVTTTDFSLTTDLTEASFPGAGNMYDPGVYAISTNPGSLHNQWVEYGGDNPKMVLNGFTSGVQTVWQQEADGTICSTPGSTLQYEFTADVANVLPLDQYSDGGANIEVVINGVSIGSADLTSNNGTPVSISGGLVPATNSVVIQVLNHATVYVGNDFSLDNLSLVQVGDCTLPATAEFNFVPSDPTCESYGVLDTSVFPFDGDGYVITVDRPFDGPSTYILTATADEGYFFTGEGDPYVRTVEIEVLDHLSGPECYLHVTAVFDITPTPPTCDADGSLPTFPIIREGYTLTIDGTGVGTHTITATAADGYVLDGPTTAQVTVLPRIVSEECTPDIGGRTIGFWTNKNGTAAGAPLWNAAKAPYANAIPAGTTFAQAQALLKAATSSTNLGRDMLRAQFIATALNVQYIANYGAQHITVPASSAVDGGQVVTVTQFLADVNAAWNGASLDTKAEITSVKDVLDAINQDLASVLFV